MRIRNLLYRIEEPTPMQRGVRIGNRRWWDVPLWVVVALAAGVLVGLIVWPLLHSFAGR